MFDLDTGSQMLILFAVLLVLRVPVAFSLGLSALYAMWQMGFGLDLVGDLIASAITKFSLLAIPFFILAGVLMGTAGMADRMIRFFRVLIGGLPGGMGVVGVVVGLFWGAVSGSGPASVAAIGPMIIRGMVEDGYPKPFAAALVCTGAALSIVIPPSIGLVVYGVIAEVSIGDLFIAAILPGLVMGVMMLAALPFAAGARRAAKSASLESLSPMPYADQPGAAGSGCRCAMRPGVWPRPSSFWAASIPASSPRPRPPSSPSSMRCLSALSSIAACLSAC